MKSGGWAQSLRSPFTRWAIALPLLMCIVITIFGALAFRETQQALLGEFYTALREEVVILEFIYREEGFGALQKSIERRGSRQETQRVYLLTNRKGEYLAGNLHTWPATVPVKDETSIVFKDLESGDTIAAEIFLLYGDNRLLVGRRAVYEQVASHLIRNYVWLCAAMLITAILSGLIFSRLIKRRLNVISQTAHNIRLGHQQARIPLAGSRDEIDGVIHELNTLLDQQDKLLAYARQTSSAIAHDLRQPLSLLRGKLLELSEIDANNSAVKNAALDQLDQILALFSAVLRLGRLESGALVLHNENINLKTLADDVAELYQPLFEDAGHQIHVIGHATERLLDRELIFTAVCNLLENALRYGQSRIDINISDNALEVRDFGPGVDNAELQRLSEPFYKAETSRHSIGHGLGLSLVKAIAELHGGQLQLSNTGDGFSARIIFP